MTESLEQHYRRVLGLEEPWVVEAVDLDLVAQRVEIRLGVQVDTRGLKCPECGKWAALYDHAPETRWRHLESRGLVSSPRNSIPFVAIKMGRRQGGPSRTGVRRAHI